eukprot:TRINITY_DN34824_c0_g1_i1.p1 TRINITY_DN34824_c0_g1~~TRINITY_DN34824_c0_g1_i1.p1  ORF type:complete len:484 (+),score=118.78 TRINITY_DN34824_c0_g1_i1:199-1650(+)
MGNVPLFGGHQADEDDEQTEQDLARWRPAGETHHQHASIRRRKAESKSSDSSDGESHGGAPSADSESVASSASKPEGSVDSDGDKSKDDDEEKKSEGSKDEDMESSADGSEAQMDAEAVTKKSDSRRNKKWVPKTEFEALLTLHEPLSIVVEEPAEILANEKKRGRTGFSGKAVLENINTSCRNKAKSAVGWMMERGYEECGLRELATAMGEDPDELRYALEHSGRFIVDTDGMVKKAPLQVIYDAMTNDIEAMDEVLDRMRGSMTAEDVKVAAESSGGELRLKNSGGIDLLEMVDLEAEDRLFRAEEKEMKLRAKEAKAKLKMRRGRKQQSEEESSSSSSDDNVGGRNKDAERKALAFRRLQVQRKIEEFLKSYTKGQNLVKINAKQKRYHRRVYVDTTKKALVVQGASGPKFFPFASMREVDIDTQTTKEGRVETLVICAIEKGGRIVKELTLSFPDQAKANTFVNCVTLFATALRSAPQR